MWGSPTLKRPGEKGERALDNRERIAREEMKQDQ
jgi:hypothetical protein